MSLQSFLEADGYRRVPLTRNGVGHFETGGTLAGNPVRVLIDTGAGSTVVSLDLARKLGLKINLLDRKGGGAGGAQLDIYQLEENNLLLDQATPRPNALYAVDLSHVNAALALKGATPVEVILGVDVFERQAAVIDYGSSSLFLKDV
jgi:Aspartyl protease